MPDFRCAQAAGAGWRALVESCLAQLGGGAANLGFVYATDVLSDHLAEIVAQLRRRSGVAHWVGTVGIGVCATAREYLDEPALAVMVGDFEPDSFRVFSGVASEADAEKVALRCGAGAAHFAIVHADPFNRRIAEVVARLARRVESGFLVGGLTSSRRRSVQVADGVVEGGLSGVSFSDGVAIATRLTQGCAPLGAKHVVTACQHNVIVSLDGRPPLDVLREDMGEALGRDLARVGSEIFVALLVPGSDTGDYVVRNLVGIDPTNRLIAVGDVLRPGSGLMFCRRDARSAQQDMSRMLESIRQGLYTRPRGGVYYSCLGRGASLFGPDSAELRMIADALGEFPLVGFFCNGEISHNRLYGYTGVLTLFV